MKKLLFLLFVAFLTTELYAQTSDAEATAIVNLLGVQKKEIIASLVRVNPKDSAVFWKLYDQYQEANKSMAKNRIQLYEKTAMSYANMNAPVADSLAKRFFDNRMKQEKSLEEFYQKIKNATNAITAFEFYQAEVYILTQVRAQIMQQIPTYSEFMMAHKK
jgi:hypothetical protein